MTFDVNDAVTIACAAAIVFVILLLLSFRAVLRVLRMRRFERMLGTLHWPFIFALDERNNKFPKGHKGEIEGREQGS